MFPGSMLPPGVQMAAHDYREAPYDDEETFAQKHGRLVHFDLTARPKRLALMGTPILVVLALIVLQVLG